MRKQWLGICIAAGMLAACTSDDGQQQTVSVPQPAVCNGPIVEISGADPRFEPLNATANQDYQRDGKSYKIVQDPSRFSQAGLAAIYDAEPGSNLTASGEAFDPTQLTAAHPTLPIPSYARITNLANGRMIVVRINDRGPYGNDRVISLSRAAADRLNTSNNTKVRIDPIIVAQDGSLSGPGMACTTVAKQTYALPAPPDLSGGAGTSSVSGPQGDILPVSNSTLKSEDPTGAPVTSSGFLGAPTTLAPGVLEGSEPTPAPQPVVTAPSTTPATSPAMVTPQAVSQKRQRQLYGASRGRKRSGSCATVPTATGTEVRRPRSRNSKWRGLADPAWPIRQQSRSQYLAATFANRSPITVIYYYRAVA